MAKSENQLIETWIDEWQRWLNAVNRDRLGYPRKASHLAQRTGGVKEPVNPNPTAERMDKAMSGLKQINRRSHDAIWFKYVTRAGNNDICARMMGRSDRPVSRQTYERYLEKGESFIMGVFFDKK